MGIRQVAQESWRHDYPDVLTRESIHDGLDEWYATDQIELELARNDRLMLVADTDERVVGFAHGVWDDNEGDILRLYVTPEHRGQEIGRQLLEHTRSELFEKGVDRIVALVLAANDLGNEFYRAFGFEKRGEDQTKIAGEFYDENTYVYEQSA